MKNIHKNMRVTVVVNSCGRLDLLKRTMDSFSKFNTYPIEKIIIVDDSGDVLVHNQLKNDYSDCQLILKEHRGLIACIDDAFSQVETPYIFKLEDDWEFYQSGFIEASLSIMELNPSIVNVWLRERNDTNGHPVELGSIKVYKESCLAAEFSLMAIGYLNDWHGMTFNPSIWRLSDYQRLSPFVKYAGEGSMGIQERNMCGWYYRLGYRAAILKNGYVKHIGDGRRTYVP